MMSSHLLLGKPDLSEAEHIGTSKIHGFCLKRGQIRVKHTFLQEVQRHWDDIKGIFLLFLDN